jgi:hypothetical protein
VVTKAAFEVAREAHFESAWIVLGLDLDEVEHALIGSRRRPIAGCLITGPAARGEFLRMAEASAAVTRAIC